MSFRNDQQRGAVCQALTDRLRKGDFWLADAHGTPRPTSGLRVHLARVGTTSEAQLVRFAWDVWNGDGKSTMSTMLATLDGSNLRMVGELLVAMAAPNPSPISDWCVRWCLGSPDAGSAPPLQPCRCPAPHPGRQPVKHVENCLLGASIAAGPCTFCYAETGAPCVSDDGTWIMPGIHDPRVITGARVGR